ncbi:MAG: hypothetical protein QOD77_1849 [Thermoplasmata archaeon]|jgi:hypothetical protein|nr:hypothetical protein [Thermoplasmata archaeon]
MPKAPRQRRTSIRTASDAVQDQYVARIRALADDPTVVLPEPVGPEHPVLAKLRRRLKAGKLPVTARFDKGLVGAVRVALSLADVDSAPRMVDARVDGNRRFYLQRGHVVRLCNLGVQNWDDPLSLMLAYGRLAPKHGLHLFAGDKLWCSGAKPNPPPEWFAALARRTGVPLTPNDDGAACPHGDRPRLELRMRNGPALLVCGPCGAKSASGGMNLHGHLLQRYLSDRPARPVELAVRLPDGKRHDLPDTLQASYRAGRADEAAILEVALQAFHGSRADGGYVAAGRTYPTQSAFLDALGLAPWEMEAVRRMTADGHIGPSLDVPVVLAAHADKLPEAVEALLPGDGAAFARKHAGTEARTLLRMAHDEAQRRARTRDLPVLEGVGPLGQWMDAFVRQARTLDRGELLQQVRKEIGNPRHPAHLYAFLCAAGLESEGERSFTLDQREAGKHWSGAAAKVMASTGEGYRLAVLEYLRETGAGEGA